MVQVQQEATMVWLALVAFAEAKNPCKELKPREKIDPAAIELARTALQVAIGAVGVPVAAGAVATLPPSATLSSALGGNASARSQALYEICRLKEIGMLSPVAAEALTVEVLTGKPPTPAPRLRALAPELVDPF